MSFLITIGVFVLLTVFVKIFPSLFTKIFAFIFSNNTFNIIILIFAVIGAIVIFSTIWKLITSLANNTAKIASMEETISAQEKNISNILAEIEDLQTTSNALLARIEALEKQSQQSSLMSIADMQINADNSYVLFGNGLLIQWGHNTCSSKGVISQTLPKQYSNIDYLIIMTPAVSQTTTTVWTTRVKGDAIKTGSFNGYITVRTNGGNDYSNGAGYYWFTIGLAS